MNAFAGLELLTTAVLMLDENLEVTYANPAAETLFAQGRSHMVGVPFDRALPGNDTCTRCRSRRGRNGYFSAPMNFRSSFRFTSGVS